MQAGNKVTYISSESYQCRACCSRTFANSAFVISAFTKAKVPVTSHMLACACLKVAWQYPYILGMGWADDLETRSNSQSQKFFSKLVCIHERTICNNYMVCYKNHIWMELVTIVYVRNSRQKLVTLLQMYFVVSLCYSCTDNVKILSNG